VALGELFGKLHDMGINFIRAAQSMTDLAVAGQLKALADDYQRRAEKASRILRVDIVGGFQVIGNRLFPGIF
jgi:hypothetical protein